MQIKLTMPLVAELCPPEKGEAWVADKSVQGLGIRLWATPSGGSMAYAIRVADKSGRMHRRTYQPNVCNSPKLMNAEFLCRLGREDADPTFAQLLPDARQWARDEIRKIKGKPTSCDLSDRKRVRKQQYGESLSFGEAAKQYIHTLRRNERSNAYIDRREFLLAQFVPEEISAANICELKVGELAKWIKSFKVRPALMLELKGFFGCVYTFVEREYSLLGHRRDDFHQSFWISWGSDTAAKYPELIEWEDQYQVIFEQLVTYQDKWQQAYCIRLFFEFGAPLSRLMSARWNQIVDEFWYPFAPSEFAYWFHKRERVDDNAMALLDKVHDMGVRDFGEQDYWFPSSFGQSSTHIKSINHVWSRVMQATGLGFYPLSHVAASYRQPNTPSYHKNFINTNSWIWRQQQENTQKTLFGMGIS